MKSTSSDWYALFVLLIQGPPTRNNPQFVPFPPFVSPPPVTDEFVCPLQNSSLTPLTRTPINLLFVGIVSLIDLFPGSTPRTDHTWFVAFLKRLTYSSPRTHRDYPGFLVLVLVALREGLRSHLSFSSEGVTWYLVWVFCPEEDFHLGFQIQP